MILYSLRCAAGHQFDAWFRNGAAYDTLAAAGEVACPVCGATKITKAPMAPRIGKHGKDAVGDHGGEPVCDAAPADAPAAEPTAGDLPDPEISPADFRRALTALRTHVETTCDYVGERFPEEARRIHYKETEPRAIYGEASSDEVEALREEGVTFRRIPWLPRGDS